MIKTLQNHEELRPKEVDLVGTRDYLLSLMGEVLGVALTSDGEDEEEEEKEEEEEEEEEVVVMVLLKIER
ncbi:hypothetical protein E2C01_086485 [Portunus trituberculatus]|uniref:Uncharacterized protein n=1 Tax=Portunus trituberculatus TaxID=210409 RepID=A0A5B7JDL3_PORTR|nr:hypothetical protein [Portunus trituberculatus]